MQGAPPPGPRVGGDLGRVQRQAGQLVRQRLGMPRLLAARRAAEDRDQRDHGHFDLLAARYKYLRTFTPAVIAALPLAGNTASPDVAALLKAVGVLRGLNAAGHTTVPAEAATAEATVFVPTRWRGYLHATRGQGRGAAYRHYWELSVLYGVQAGLRSGDLWVPGSRRYTAACRRRAASSRSAATAAASSSAVSSRRFA
ncbi:MAG: hypothetical protein ACXVW7_20410 [Trebonia sp.]